MGIFWKKEDTRYIKEFDTALKNINSLSSEFRDAHFRSIDMFQKNFEKEKSAEDFEKERLMFERHLALLEKIKFNADLLVDEAFKLVRNEVAITEKDRQALRRIMEPKKKTGIHIKDDS